MKRLLLLLLAALALPTAVNAEPVWIEYHRVKIFDYKKEKCPFNHCGFISYVDVKSIVKNKEKVFFNLLTRKFGVADELRPIKDSIKISGSMDCKKRILTLDGSKIKVKDAINSHPKDLYNFVCDWK